MSAVFDRSRTFWVNLRQQEKKILLRRLPVKFCFPVASFQRAFLRFPSAFSEMIRYLLFVAEAPPICA